MSSEDEKKIGCNYVGIFGLSWGEKIGCNYLGILSPIHNIFSSGALFLIILIDFSKALWIYSLVDKI